MAAITVELVLRSGTYALCVELPESFVFLRFTRHFQSGSRVQVSNSHQYFSTVGVLNRHHVHPSQIISCNHNINNLPTESNERFSKEKIIIKCD